MLASVPGDGSTFVPEGVVKRCEKYEIRDVPPGFVQGWSGFDALHTTQFILPAETLERDVRGILIYSEADEEFSAYYQDETLVSHKGRVDASYPPKSSYEGAPLHLTLVPQNGRGDKLQALWIRYD